MRKLISLALSYSLFTALIACGQKPNKPQVEQTKTSEVKSTSSTANDYEHNVEALLPKSDGKIVAHTYYTLSYSEEHEQAEWVAYELEAEELIKKANRTDDFRPDAKISTGSAQLADYKGSGYDRGHLAPAADMSFSRQAMSESFYLSNMSPQAPSLNRGAWKELEEQMRDWARARREIMVYTGPVLEDGLPTIGKSKVSIPKWYYKIAVDLEENEAIAFLMPNEKCSKPLQAYAVPIQKIEDMTGIDFMPKLDDAIEEELEALLDVQDWFVDSANVNNTQNHATKPNDSVQTDTKVGQCAAKTASGKRCSRNAQAGNKYCWQHD